MKVIWSYYAKGLLDKTADYIAKEFGRKTRQDFKRQVRSVNDLLKTNPFLGQLEPLLINNPIEYRSILATRLNKIIYYVDGDTIRVADFWDCRRDPNYLATHLNIS